MTELSSFEQIRAAIADDPENAAMRELGYAPLYTAGAGSHRPVGCPGMTRAVFGCASGSG